MTLLTEHKYVKDRLREIERNQRKYDRSKADLRAIVDKMLAQKTDGGESKVLSESVHELSKGISSVLRAYGEDITAGEVYGMFQVDALLKCLYEKERVQLSGTPCVSHLEEVENRGYPYQMVLETRNELWPANAKHFNVEAATIFAKRFSTNELLPVFVFTQLADPTTTEYLLDVEGSGCEFTLGWLLGRLRKKAFFQAEAKERSFRESARYLQLFMACLRNDDQLATACKELLKAHEKKPRIPYYVCKTMPRSAAKKVMYGELEGKRKESSHVGYEDLVLDSALNLYVFNQETLLLDWMWATEHTTMDVLGLKDMFMIKALPLPYDDMDETLRDSFLKACCCVFEKIYEIISEKDEDVLKKWYEVAGGVLDQFTIDVIEQAEDFNYNVGNLCLMDGSEGKEAPITHLYKEMVVRTKNRNQ